MQEQNLQMTIKGQQDSAIKAEEEKRKTKAEEIDGEIRKTEITALTQNQGNILNWVTSIMKPGADGVTAQVPAEYKPIINAVIQNVMIKSVASTKEQQEMIMAEMQAAQEQQQMQQQQAQQPMQEQQNINQPPQPQPMAA